MKLLALAVAGITLAKAEDPNLNEGEIVELMHETFAKKDKSKSVHDILAEQEEDQAPKEQEKKQSDVNLDEMSLTEHLEYAKQQAEKEEKERVKKEKEEAKRKAEQEKKDKEKAKKDAKIKAEKEKQRKLQAMKDAEDLGFNPEDFADGDLDLG